MHPALYIRHWLARSNEPPSIDLYKGQLDWTLSLSLISFTYVHGVPAGHVEDGRWYWWVLITMHAHYLYVE